MPMRIVPAFRERIVGQALRLASLWAVDGLLRHTQKGRLWPLGFFKCSRSNVSLSITSPSGPSIF
jgi:hypothetical protein